MRISDWSSDVCSSDLGVTPNSSARFGPGTVGLPVTCGGVPVRSGDLIVADRDGVVVVPFDRIDAVAERVAAIREAEAATEAKVKAGMVRPPWLDQVFVPGRVRRSEEHTSELQSLMRISYAVFCLKK